MSRTVSAVYENGVFRPLEEVELDEGEEVEVLLDSTHKPSAEDSQRILDEIAELPVESENNGFSSADHDLVLYPKE
jgi:predicted DNA-binding antitoxin AbrB/MazE fold protein